MGVTRALGILLLVGATALLTACAQGTGHVDGRPGSPIGGTAEAASSTAPATAPLPGWRVLPGQFVSLRFAPVGLQTRGSEGFLEVALSDARTGTVLRRLLPATTGTGMQVSGLALDRVGDLWITYSKGPISGGQVAGGDPHPHTCANEIDVVHVGTGRVTVVMRSGDNILIGDAQPSPDGRQLVYTESACTAQFDSYLRVTDLRSDLEPGRSWTLDQSGPGCHLLESPAWSTSGRALLVNYGPPSEPGADSQTGACPVWYAGRLVTLDPAKSQPGLAGPTVRADAGCQINSVVGLADDDVLAIEGCGTAPEFLDGPAQLLVMDAKSHLVRRLALGDCTDGNELSANPAGTAVLVSAYLYCNPPGNPGPATRLWEYRGGTLRPVTTVAGDTDAFRLLTWAG
jgi:hypothetical protein